MNVFSTTFAGLVVAISALAQPPLFPAPVLQDRVERSGAATQVLTQPDPVQEGERTQVVFYRPRSMDPRTLANVIQHLVYQGGALGSEGTRGGEFGPITFRDMGDLVLIAARPSLVQPALDLLRQLDEANASDGSEDDQVVETFQYRLRFASHETVRRALEPFTNFPVVSGPGQQQMVQPAVTIVPETGMVVSRQPRAVTAEMRRILEEVDRPTPQVRVSYYLIRGSSQPPVGDSALPVPNDLERDLKAIVPVAHLELVSFGVVQGDALSPKSFEDQLVDSRVRLEMRPTTFDAQTGALGVERVEMHFTRYLDGPSTTTKHLSTSARLEPGGYTVLGGVGAEPVFLALRLERL